MKTYTERFDTAFDYIRAHPKPINLTVALGRNNEGLSHSIAASEGVHIDDAKRPTSKAIGLMAISQLHNPKIDAYTRRIDRVELYRDAEGEVVPNFTRRADAYAGISGGVNHGYPETEFEVPEVSKEIAINSALAAVEQAIEAHQIHTL